MQELSSKLGWIVMFILAYADRMPVLSDTESNQIAPKFEERNTTTSNLYIGDASCPPWSYLSNGSCSCKIHNDPYICKLNEDEEEVSVLDCYCTTYDKDSSVIELGHCVYNCAGHKHGTSVDVVYHQMPQNISEWNGHMCGKFNRVGSLCGSCDHERNFYARAYSFDLSCVKCEHSSSQWWKYITAAYLPLTIFCFIILILKLDIHSSPISGFVILAQILTIPAQNRVTLQAVQNNPTLSPVIKLLAAFFGIWNLDFFRVYPNNICLGLGSLANLFLDLVVAVYPMVVIAITYILIDLYDHNYRILILAWKPFRFLLRRFYKKLSIKSSIIDSITAFMFLANIKVQSVMFDVLTPVRVYQIHSSKNVTASWRLYYDPTIHYFSSEHQLYAAVALIIVFLLYICPLLILSFHSWRFFQTLISLLPHRLQIFYNTFMDSFYGCYKDGTEPGAANRRWYALVWPITRGLIGILYSTLLSESFYSFAAILVALVTISAIIADPFKSHLKHLSSSMSIFILFVGLFYVGCTVLDQAAKSFSTSAIYSIYITLIVIVFLSLLFILMVTLRSMPSCRQN